MESFNAEYLKELPVLSQIPLDHLNWLLRVSEIKQLKAGDVLFNAGEPAENMYLLLEGQLKLSLEKGGNYTFFAALKKGEVTGRLPFSRVKLTGCRAVASVDTVVLCLHQRHFPEMESVSPEMVQQLVGLMTDRVREFTRKEQQHEKLVALGKLSAGLAHELNNPIAAIGRSSSELLRMHHAVPEKFKRILNIRISPEQVDQVNALLFPKIAAGLQSNLSLLERNNLEEEVLDWLEEQGVDDGYALAGTFVNSGFGLTDLQGIATILKKKHLPEIFDWIANTLETEKVICDIQAASKRISELVNAVKTYSHMDQGQEKEKTHLPAGINSTLTMLNHKLKDKQIQVVLQFEEGLPQIPAYVGELNQLWTNLIDNAVDAMPQGGTLTIAAQQEENTVSVRIADNGVGIPAEVLPHIYEPFFTTKPIGQGTGLGLDIVHKVVAHHGATISVTSEPGDTAFQICFPLD